MNGKLKLIQMFFMKNAFIFLTMLKCKDKYKHEVNILRQLPFFLIERKGEGVGGVGGQGEGQSLHLKQTPR